MKSLLLVGQQRGFTSQTYSIILEACPELTDNFGGFSFRYPLEAVPGLGEVLFTDNLDQRYSLDDNLYLEVKEILDGYREGFLIKDVVQPFFVLRYMEENPDAYNVLHIYRDPRQCMVHQELRGWPVINSYGFVAEYCERFPTVYFKDLIIDPQSLWEPLRSFGYQVEEFDYTDNELFQKKKAEVLSYWEDQ